MTGCCVQPFTNITLSTKTDIYYIFGSSIRGCKNWSDQSEPNHFSEWFTLSRVHKVNWIYYTGLTWSVFRISLENLSVLHQFTEFYKDYKASHLTEADIFIQRRSSCLKQWLQDASFRWLQAQNFTLSLPCLTVELILLINYYSLNWFANLSHASEDPSQSVSFPKYHVLWHLPC